MLINSRSTTLFIKTQSPSNYRVCWIIVWRQMSRTKFRVRENEKLVWCCGCSSEIQTSDEGVQIVDNTRRTTSVSQRKINVLWDRTCGKIIQNMSVYICINYWLLAYRLFFFADSSFSNKRRSVDMKVWRIIKSGSYCIILLGDAAL